MNMAGDATVIHLPEIDCTATRIPFSDLEQRGGSRPSFKMAVRKEFGLKDPRKWTEENL